MENPYVTFLNISPVPNIKKETFSADRNLTKSAISSSFSYRNENCYLFN